MSISKLFNLSTLLGLIFLFVLSGCVDKSTEEADAELQVPEAYPGGVYEQGDGTSPGGYYIHTVQYPDESISIIAKWFTGDLMNWEVLAKANPDINPNRIFLGDTIKIPRNIMTVYTPITAEFVEESQPQRKRKKAKPAQVESTPVTDEPAKDATVEDGVDDEPLLFGPKGYSATDS